jgi:hypothetical protein
MFPKYGIWTEFPASTWLQWMGGLVSALLCVVCVQGGGGGGGGGVSGHGKKEKLERGEGWRWWGNMQLRRFGGSGFTSLTTHDTSACQMAS